MLEKSRQILGLPAEYRIAIVPASDTGAVEMALWSLLGPRGVDVLAWESFGEGWVTDIVKQLKLQDVRPIRAPYGQLPDLTQVDWNRDVIFTWNGTTSGVKVPSGEWIPDTRQGLAIADATSAVYAMDIPWQKLDVVTWSWQKVLGGEGAHGMLVLSPRAVERLEAHTPAWPMPKLFRMTVAHRLQEGIFQGDTINTPSMLCVEDAVDGLNWALQIGGLPALKARSEANLAVLERWVERTPWVQFLAEEKPIRSNTSVCFVLKAPWFLALDLAGREVAARKISALLDAENAAYDVASYRDAPAGLRIWCGATVETADVEALLPWLDWAYAEVAATYG